VLDRGSNESCIEPRRYSPLEFDARQLPRLATLIDLNRPALKSAQRE
jgi:hypothetical protein